MKQGRRPLGMALAMAMMLVAGCGDRMEPDSGMSGQAPSLPTDLQARVEARLDGLDAITALYAKHIPSGRELEVRADRPMNTLSVIKIPIMVQAFLDDASGRLDLDARYEMTPEKRRRGSGLLQTFTPGLRPTLRDLVTQMIVTSDNTATDMVLGAVGLDRVNEMLEGEGYRDTRVKMSTGDLFREVWIRADSSNASMSHAEVYERGFPSDGEASARSFAIEGDSTIWLGRTTPREMGRLLEQILQAEIASEAASEEMVSILQRQLYSSRLPQRVQWLGVSVAHKTGDWPPIAGNDVGILFYDGGPTLVSVFTNQNTGDFFELEATLGWIAADLVNAWR